MIKSQIFYTNTYKSIEQEVKKFLNNYPNFLSKTTVRSTRAVGDAIQSVISENFKSILEKSKICVKKHKADFPRRAMADFAFLDQQDLYYLVDVKTHRKEPGFHMPNLTSVRKLAQLYENDNNYFVVLMVAYNITSSINVKVENVHFIPIEFLSLECLTIGALGWGQIQIANSENIIINHGYSRKKWMLGLCELLLQFYPNEIKKIENRISYFNKVRNLWKKKPDIWE